MSKKGNLLDMNGIVVGVAILAIMWLRAFWGTKGKGSPFAFDAQSEPGAFEKLHAAYLDIVKFVLGLASGSIVLLVGSSALHATAHLPPSFASPLFLLAMSIMYGILFMMFLTTKERRQNNFPIDIH